MTEKETEFSCFSNKIQSKIQFMTEKETEFSCFSNKIQSKIQSKTENETEFSSFSNKIQSKIQSTTEKETEFSVKKECLVVLRHSLLFSLIIPVTRHRALRHS